MLRQKGLTVSSCFSSLPESSKVATSISDFLFPFSLLPPPLENPFPFREGKPYGTRSTRRPMTYLAKEASHHLAQCLWV